MTIRRTVSLLRRRVLGDSLRALADGVLGQLTRKQQTNGRLDLAARDRRATVVVRRWSDSPTAHRLSSLPVNIFNKTVAIAVYNMSIESLLRITQ